MLLKPRSWSWRAGPARSAVASRWRAGCTASRCGSRPGHGWPPRAGGRASAERERSWQPVVWSKSRLEPTRAKNAGPNLHDELGRLPDSFREPLVLCYLEGLTQEQAATQLRCPLGTVQSRLARGRAKLKKRLTKRGFDRSDVFPGSALGTQLPASAPEAWAAATVRLAMRFTQAKGTSVAGTGSAATLAEEVLRAVVLTKLKVVLGTILFAAVLISGAATWARQQTIPAPLAVAAKVHIPEKIPEPERLQKRAFPPPGSVTRVIRGVVKDEQGRPMAKVWVGDRVGPVPRRKPGDVPIGVQGREARSP